MLSEPSVPSLVGAAPSSLSQVLINGIWYYSIFVGDPPEPSTLLVREQHLPIQAVVAPMVDIPSVADQMAHSTAGNRRATNDQLRRSEEDDPPQQAPRQVGR